MERCAVISDEGRFSYAQLLNASARAGAALLGGRDDLCEDRIAYLIPPGFEHVAVQRGIWKAGGIAVPLCPQHPPRELEHVLSDASVSVIVVHPGLASTLERVPAARNMLRVLSSEAIDAPLRELPDVHPGRRAMILYTSGTTGRPKGVVTTHANIRAQIESLVEAWGWTADDHILHVLPLHHVHGIINVLACALWVGACCEMLPRFDAGRVWDRIKGGALTMFMAVPTIYARLISFWEAAAPEERKALSEGCAGLRLMVSGSAALPVATLRRWQSISGHVLLERYGMTEIGMALSNPLQGARIPGCVGKPLPLVDVRLVDEQGLPVALGAAGEIEVRGPTVFLEYWSLPDATREAFHDGWFRTGDVAVCEDGIYRILGRRSVDIIKTGGYKVSALEIEDVLRMHPGIRDCAVVGVPDPLWGEAVSAALVLAQGCSLTLESLRSWAREHLPGYKIPQRILCLDELPRNEMGKVVKPRVAVLMKE